jgi:putative oxidoreductase
MIKQIFRTSEDIGAFIIRITLGVVIFPHGAQKLLGWFDGGGFMGTIESFKNNFDVHPVLTVLVILAESVGSLLLILGIGGRFMAFSIGAVMAGAIALVHWQHGFFIDWRLTGQGHGIEFHVLALGMAAMILIKGSGLWSVDSLLTKKWGKRRLGYSS